MRRAFIHRSVKIMAFFCLVVLCIGNNTFASDDWQYWGTFTVDHSISERDGLSLLYEVYAKEKMSDDYVYLVIPTYKRIIGHGFSVVGGGYFESVQKSGNEWNNIRSVLLGPVFQVIPCDGWIIESQTKFYYQLAPNVEWDYYRPRLSIQRTFRRFSLVVEDEMRVDLTGERETDFFRNRLFLTGKKKFGNSLVVGIGYICQSDKIHDKWESFHALHSVLSYTY